MKRKIFTLIMVLMMIMTMMPTPGAHNHAHAEEACEHTGATVVSSLFLEDKFQVTLSCSCVVVANAVKTVEPATCKEPEKTIYTAEGYPTVQWIEKGFEKAGHDWNNYEGICAVCGDQHMHTGCNDTKCTTCGFQPASDHFDFYDAEGNLGEDGHCDVCKGCLMHVGEWAEWKHDEKQHWIEHVCGEKFNEAAHTWENGVCTFANCGYECAHDWEDGDCTLCDVICAHDERDEDGVCTVCGNACDHDWNNLAGKCTKCGAIHTHTVCGMWNGEKCEKCGYSNMGMHPDVNPHNGVCDVCGESMDASTDGDMSNTSWMELNFDDKNHWMEHKTTGEIDESTVEPHDWANDKGECACGAHHIHDVCVVTASFSDKWNCSLCGMLRAAMVQDYWPADGHCDNGCGGHITSETQFNATHHWEWCEQCGKILGDYGADGSYIEEGTKVEHTWKNGECVCGAKCEHELEVVDAVFDDRDPSAKTWHAYAKCKNCDLNTYISGSMPQVTLVEVTQEATCQQVELSTFSNTFSVFVGGKSHKIPGMFYNVETAGKADHDWVDGVCTVCGAGCNHDYDLVAVQEKGVYSPAKTHQHKLCCSNCGLEMFDGYLYNCSNYSGGNNCSSCGGAIWHNGGEATCTEKKVCDSCGLEYGSFGDHDFVAKPVSTFISYIAATDQYEVVWKAQLVCDNGCGKSFNSNGVVYLNSDEVVEPTCTIPGSADVEVKLTAYDGKLYEVTYTFENIAIPVIDHDWSNYEGMCTVCGESHTHDKCRVTWENSGYVPSEAVCTICGYNLIGQCPDLDSDGHCDTCKECLPDDRFELKYDDTYHWYEHYCGEIWDYYGDPYEEHDFDEVTHACECGACDHNYVAIDNKNGTHTLTCEWCEDAYDPMKCADYNGDGLCDSCKYELFHAGGTPTCTEQATCQNCGEKYGELLSHDWDNEENPGFCARGCGTFHTHTEADYVYEHIDGTEGNASKHSWSCGVCSYVVSVEWTCSDENGDFICDKCEYEFHVHDWSNNDGVCAGGCGTECKHENVEYVSDDNGSHSLECLDCGLVYFTGKCYDYDDGICDACDYELFHNWSNNDGICANCGEECKHEAGHKAINKGDKKHMLVCPTCGHNFDGLLLDCYDRDGDRNCDACGVEVYHLHDWSNKDGECATCGEKCEHDDVDYVSDNEGNHTLMCLECGVEYITGKCYSYDDGLCDACEYEIYHYSKNPATCTEGAVCDHCGEAYADALDHDWSNKDGVCVRCGEECEHPNEKAVSNGKGQHMLECVVCGNTYGDLLINCREGEIAGVCASCDYEMYHAGGTPTCTEQAICQNCGEPYGKTLPHTWKFNEEASTLNVEKKTFNIVIDCSECGKVYPIATSYNAKTEVTQEGDCDTAELTKFYTSGSAWGVAFGIEEIVETKAATGEHNYEVVKSLDATCIEPAYYWYECSVCGAEKNGEDPTGALAEHDYEVVKSEPANCIYPAYYWYECSVCGAEKNGEEGEATGIHVDLDNDYVCDVCDFVMGNPCDHEGKGTYTFTVEANCSNEGYVEVHCAYCEEVISKETLEVNDAHVFYNGVCLLCGGKEEDVTCDHEGKGTYTFTVEATCSAEGVVEVYCSGCTKLISSEILEKNDAHVFYNGVCLLCGEAEVKECEHNYELVKEQKADCQFPAYYWYKCSECGNELNYEDKTGALGDHDYEVVKSEPATCQFPAYYWYECTVCGAEMNREEGDVGDHNYELVKEQKADCQFPAYYWFECTECGAEKNYEDKTGALGDHDYEVVKSEPATCQFPAYYWYECTVCGAEMNREEGDVGDHNYELVKEQKVDCQFPAYYWFECTECGAEKNYEDKTGALGDHAWDDGEVTTEPTVDAEGVKTFTCDVCGETKTESIEKLDHEHDYKAVVTAPTCTEAGYTTYTCECGDSYVADEVKATGHSGQVNITQPTCTEIGFGKGVCDLCGETFFYQEIPAKGHSYDAVVTAPTCTEAGYTTYTCECGESYVADEVEALGHAWDEGEVTTEPTFDAEGVKTFTCGVCGETKTEAIDKLEKPEHAHDYEAVVTAPTCTAAGYTTYTCECGDSYVGNNVDALGHNVKKYFSFNKDYTKRVVTIKCTVCGETIDSYEENY